MGMSMFRFGDATHCLTCHRNYPRDERCHPTPNPSACVPSCGVFYERESTFRNELKGDGSFSADPHKDVTDALRNQGVNIKHHMDVPTFFRLYANVPIAQRSAIVPGTLGMTLDQIYMEVRELEEEIRPRALIQQRRTYAASAFLLDNQA